MPIPKLEITNPQAIELINKIKSGQFVEPLKIWVKKNRWYLVAAGIFLVLVIALVIGKALSEQTPVPTFTPPDIETVTPTETVTIQSDFSGVKKEIQDFNTDLPDPFIPTFDNDISLEAPVI